MCRSKIFPRMMELIARVFKKRLAKLFGMKNNEDQGSDLLPRGFDCVVVGETRKMIQGIMTLDERSAKEVMVPRVDASFISCDSKKDEIVAYVLLTGYSRYPTFKENIDNVVGILYVKDLVRVLYSGDEFKVEDIVRRPYFVPETKRLDELLREFKHRRLHIAVVVDEYGGVSGLLCMEDIIEHIVGDIQDEFDNESEDIIQLSQTEYLCDARVNLDYVNKKFHLSFPEQDFDTLGGFVFNLFGRIPSLYEKVEHNGLQFVIQQLDGNKIRRIKIILQKGVGCENNS